MFSSITVLNLGVMVLLQRGSSVFLNEHSDDKNLHNVPHNISLTERERANIMRKLEEIIIKQCKL